MPKWLSGKNILIHPAHNKGVVAEKFISVLKGKIYKTITANDSKSYLVCLNKLVDEYNNSYHYHCSIRKNLLMLLILVCLKELNLIIKLLNLKLAIQSDLLVTKIFSGKVTT